jgi:hypothetical protein
MNTEKGIIFNLHLNGRNSIMNTEKGIIFNLHLNGRNSIINTENGIIFNLHLNGNNKMVFSNHLFLYLRYKNIAMNSKTIGFAILATIAVMAAMASVLVATPAEAKITEEDVSCTNQGGNQPGGQQPSCGGAGLTQESENQNPSGSAPPGQNK